MLATRLVTFRTSLITAAVVAVAAVAAMVGLPRLEAQIDPWMPAEPYRYYHSIVGSVMVPDGWEVSRSSLAHGQPSFSSNGITVDIMTVLWSGTTKALHERVIEWFGDPDATVSADVANVTIISWSDRADRTIWVRHLDGGALLMRVHGNPLVQEARYLDLRTIAMSLWLDESMVPPELSS